MPYVNDIRDIRKSLGRLNDPGKPALRRLGFLPQQLRTSPLSRWAGSLQGLLPGAPTGGPQWDILNYPHRAGGVRWTSSPHPASVLLERDEGLVVRVVEPDVERPQIGMQAGVLDRDQVRRRPRFVIVRVPEARRRDERRSRLPVGPLRADDLPVVVEVASD